MKSRYTLVWRPDPHRGDERAHALVNAKEGKGGQPYAWLTQDAETGLWSLETMKGHEIEAIITVSEGKKLGKKLMEPTLKALYG